MGVVAICVTDKFGQQLPASLYGLEAPPRWLAGGNSSKVKPRGKGRRQSPLNSFAEKYGSHASASPSGTTGYKGRSWYSSDAVRGQAAQRILLADINPIMLVACAASAEVHFPAAAPLSWACSS